MADTKNISDVAKARAAYRHPELVSGSISPFLTFFCNAKWMLNQARHDGFRFQDDSFGFQHDEVSYV